MTLDRVSPSGGGVGKIGLAFSKSKLGEPFVITNIETNVSVGRPVEGVQPGGEGWWTERGTQWDVEMRE